jgi:hypothetical protein
MSLIKRLRPGGSSSAVSPFPASTSQMISMHVTAIPTANFRKVVEQLTPQLAANAVVRDDTGGIQLPGEVSQQLNLAETVVAQLLIQTGSQLAGILQPVAAPRAQDLHAIRPDLPINPPPPPPPIRSCTAVSTGATDLANSAAEAVVSCQNYLQQATAALQAGSAVDDCATQLQQANLALSALDSLDASASDAAQYFGNIDYFASQPSILKCSQTVTATIAQAKAHASASATQANQIATSAGTTALLASSQTLQAQALAKCGPSAPSPVPLAPNSIRVVTMWYGIEFQLDENTTKDFEKVCDAVSKGGDIISSIVTLLKAAVGNNPVAGAVITALVSGVPLLVENAMDKADQGSGVTLHCSLVPILGASIIFGFNIPAELVTIEGLLEAGTLAIGVGGNPILNVFWVTGNGSGLFELQETAQIILLSQTLTCRHGWGQYSTPIHISKARRSMAVGLPHVA